MACRMALFHLSFSSKVRAKKVYTFKFCTWTSMNAWDHRESSEAETQLELQWDCFPLIICRRSLQNEIWDCLAWLEFLTKYGQIKKMLSLNLIGGVWTRIDRAFFFSISKIVPCCMRSRLSLNMTLHTALVRTIYEQEGVVNLFRLWSSKAKETIDENCLGMNLESYH